MIATLPMYDRREIRAATDSLWQAIRTSLGYGPAQLTRSGDPWPLWQDQNLLLGQTCSLPYRLKLAKDVQYVGTPDYGLEGCPPGYYASVFIARRDASLSNFHNQSFAFNEPLSQSGWAGPIDYLNRHTIRPSECLRSGSHQNSARYVAEGRAAFAAIDGQSWRLIKAYDSWAKDLFEIAQSDPTPGLPMICAQRFHPAELAQACAQAITSFPKNARQALGIEGFVDVSSSAYLTLPNPVDVADYC